MTDIIMTMMVSALFYGDGEDNSASILSIKKASRLMQPTLPWEEPLASLLGARLHNVAVYIQQVLADFAEPLQHVATDALRQRGKLFASATASGHPFSHEDQSLWSFSVLLLHLVAADPLLAPTDPRWQAVIPIAAAGEILGLACDLSDDIQDGDGAFVRTHTVTLIEPLAVFFFAFLHRLLHDPRVPRGRNFLHGLLISAMMQAAEAQFLDGWYERQPTTTLADALAVTKQKAGPLISCLYQLGAYCGLVTTMPPRKAQRMSREFARLGTIVGEWHQFDNDYRDADVHATKSDRRRGKKTLPLVMEADVVRATANPTMGLQAGQDIALLATTISRRNVMAQLQHLEAVTGCSVQSLQWLAMAATST